MNTIARFFVLGLQDADRRLSAALAPRPFVEADRYLRGSVIVAAIDRATVVLHDWWQDSAVSRILTATGEMLAEMGKSGRDRAIAILLLTAVSVHVILTLVQGPRPGWFWMVIPTMAVLCASILFSASSRSNR
jgi:hypothetical protein